MNDEPNLNSKDLPSDSPAQDGGLASNEADRPENAPAPEAGPLDNSNGSCSAPEPDLAGGDARTADETFHVVGTRPESESVLGLPEPEPWPEPVDGALLLDDLLQEASRSVVLPKWGPEAVALFTVHTYGFPLRRVSAYLGIESPE